MTNKNAGFSLIEMMIVVAIVAIVTSIAVPAYTQILANNRVKATAESILAGLRNARSTAIQRNAPVRFQLVTTLDSTCALSTTSAIWILTETDQNTTGDPLGRCGMEPWTPPDPCVDSGVHLCASDPLIIAKSTVVANPTVTVTADQPIVVFSPLGRVTSDVLTGYGANAMAQVMVRSTVAGTRQWNIRIGNPNGSVKLCDAQAAAGSVNAC